jgi:hypothetical protein
VGVPGNHCHVACRAVRCRIFGPNIVNTSAGGDTSSVPSAVVVALFAFLATWVVERYGFRHERKE